MNTSQLIKGNHYVFYKNGDRIGSGRFYGTERHGCQLHGDDQKTYILYNRHKISGRLGSLHSLEASGVTWDDYFFEESPRHDQ